MRWIILALPILLVACNQRQVSESNQAEVSKRAKALEQAADVSVNAAISEMTQESFDESADNRAKRQ